MRIKGTLIRTRLEFLAERFGPEAAGRALEPLPAEDRRVLRTTLATSWLPFESLNRLDQSIVRELGQGDMDLVRELGAFAAQRILATTYRVFIDQAHGDPRGLLERLADLHAQLYDWGRVRVVTLGPSRCRVEADYAGGACRTNCLASLGFYSAALRQLSVSRAQVQEHACQAMGAALCEYDASWEV